MPQPAGPPQTHIRRSPRRPVLLVLLASALILLILAYRSRSAGFRWDLLWQTLHQADWSWLGASIFFILLSNIPRALRWQVMLRPFGRTLGVGKLTEDTAIGAAAVILLGRVGEVVRPYLISLQSGLPLSSQAAAWLLERTLDLLAVLLFFAFALFGLSVHSFSYDPAIRTVFTAGGYVFGITGLLCILILYAFRNPRGHAQQRVLSALTFLPPEVQRRAEHMLEAFALGVGCTRDPRSLALLAAYTGLEWLVIVGSAGTLFRAFAVTRGFGPLDVLVLLGFISFGSVVQVPGVGGGVQVATILALTKIYRVPAPAAAGVAVLSWVVSLAVAPLGLACAFHEGLNWSKLKLLSAKNILDDQA